MTQRKKPAQNLHKSWHQSLPAQSLVWLSSLSILSSGFVLAQTESAIDNIVPTAENTQTSGNAVRKKTVERAPRVSSPESSLLEFSTRRARLKQRLNRNVASQSSEPVRKPRTEKQASEPARQRPLRSEDATPNTSVRRLRALARSRSVSGKVSDSSGVLRPVAIPEVRVEKTQVEVSSQPRATSREDKPQVVIPAVRNLRERTSEITQPSKPASQLESNTGDTTEKPKDYNNAYIDPTDYNSRTAGKYESPNSVVLTERSVSCRTPLGQSLTSCVKAPVTASKLTELATTKTERTRATAPSWIRRSRSIEVADTTADTTRVRRTVDNNENRSGWRASRIAAVSNLDNVRVTRRAERIESSTAREIVASSKSSYNPNRFIPAPSNFAPQARTTISTALAPSGDTLPMPMTSDNAVPRPSTVAYNIPLESTLPRVAYRGGIAYNPTGLIFPLSIPAPITSIFGWRTHPITGDRRFHSGTDIGAPMGTPVIAAFTGQVEVADNVGGYGLTVILNHNNALQTLYGHMSQLYVQPGQWVQQGTLIGLVGSTGNSTGPHLHFEVRQLTQEGWVAADPSMNLQYAITQLMQSLQTAQVPQPNN